MIEYEPNNYYVEVREDIQECGDAIPYTVLYGDGELNFRLRFMKHGERIPVTKDNVIRLVSEQLDRYSVDVGDFEYHEWGDGWVWRRYVKVNGDEDLEVCGEGDDYTHIETYYVEVVYIRKELGVFKDLPEGESLVG